MSAILRSPITWILLTLGIASGVGIAKTRTKRKTKTKRKTQTKRKTTKRKTTKRKTQTKSKTTKRKGTKKGQVRKTARRAYKPKTKKRTVPLSQFKKMINANPRFTKAKKEEIIGNYRG